MHIYIYSKRSSDYEKVVFEKIRNKRSLIARFLWQLYAKERVVGEFSPVIQIRGLNKKLITQMIDMLLFALVI